MHKLFKLFQQNSLTVDLRKKRVNRCPVRFHQNQFLRAVIVDVVQAVRHDRGVLTACGDFRKRGFDRVCGWGCSTVFIAVFCQHGAELIDDLVIGLQGDFSAGGQQEKHPAEEQEDANDVEVLVCS